MGGQRGCPWRRLRRRGGGGAALLSLGRNDSLPRDQPQQVFAVLRKRDVADAGNLGQLWQRGRFASPSDARSRRWLKRERPARRLPRLCFAATTAAFPLTGNEGSQPPRGGVGGLRLVRRGPWFDWGPPRPGPTRRRSRLHPRRRVLWRRVPASRRPARCR